MTLGSRCTITFCMHLHNVWQHLWFKVEVCSWNSLFVCAYKHSSTALKLYFKKTFWFHCIRSKPMQTMQTIEGCNREINTLAPTWYFFVYQLEYPHMSDLSMLRVIVPVRHLLSSPKQVKILKKGMWRMLQCLAPLVAELWLFPTHSQVFSSSITLSSWVVGCGMLLTRFVQHVNQYDHLSHAKRKILPT